MFRPSLTRILVSGRPDPQPISMTAAPRGRVRAHSRTSLAPMAVEGARPRPARNAAATLSYPLDGSIIDTTSSVDIRALRYVELRDALRANTSNVILGVLRQGLTADTRIQLVEERLQPRLARLTSGHLQQDLAYFSGGVLIRPANLCVTDTWVAAVVELKRQCGIGRRTDNVLCLMDICQGMCVGARRRRSCGASGGSRSPIAGLTCGDMRLQGKRTQPSGALTASGELPDAFNRRTGPRICISARLIH